MIFSQYSYRNFHNENKKDHPIKDWNLMVNNNYFYCHKMSILKWIEFYFYLSIGRFKPYEIPSFHEYWTIQVNKDKKKLKKSLIEKLIECRKNPTLVKSLFNRDTNNEDVANRIRKL